MSLTDISPDQVVWFHLGPLPLNATLVYTWAVMALLAGGSWWLSRRLTTGPRVSRWQILLEVVVDTSRRQIAAMTGQDAGRYLPFIGTLFLFIAVSNLLGVVPWWVPPTASLSTTAALALCVFVAVPVYGVATEGLRGFLRHYIQPSPLMLPFHVMGELSRTLALAVRLFGNVMSGAKIVAILLVVTPFIFPIVVRLLGLLTGLIQAYIFAVLAIVYIASGMEAHGERKD